MKHCPQCKTDKAIDAFGRYARAKDGLRKVCRSCNNINSTAWNKSHPESVRAAQLRWSRKDGNGKTRAARWREANPDRNYRNQARAHLKSTFGITLDDYDRMLADQGGGCAICGAKTPGGYGKRFHVDHDHETGKIRGLLCHYHNTGLGMFGDDPSQLQAAIEYLKRFA